MKCKLRWSLIVRACVKHKIRLTKQSIFRQIKHFLIIIFLHTFLPSFLPLFNVCLAHIVVVLDHHGHEISQLNLAIKLTYFVFDFQIHQLLL